MRLAEVQGQLNLALPPFLPTPIAVPSGSLMAASVSRPGGSDRLLTLHT